MILTALNDYYRRKMADPDPARRLPAFGFEDKEIPFVIELGSDGSLAAIKDTRSGDGKKKTAARFLVPKGVKKTSGIAANLLWDTAEYAVGVDTKDKPERVVQQHAAFRARIDALPDAAQADAGIVALRRFLDDQPQRALAADPLWEEIRSANPVVSFRLAEDSDLICQRPAIVESASQVTNQEADVTESMCLVTGSRHEAERLHTAIKGVWGAQTSGANIVSFNLDAFNSYGKSQGANAPVGKHAAFAYTTALNHLLAKGSAQRIQVGDASTVFWAQQQDEVEDVFAQFFGETDDPDARTVQVKALLEAVDTGKFDGGRGEKRFYVLGLAPNAARIAVRFWHAAPLRSIASRVAAWFSDLEVGRGPNDPEYPSLFRLLTAISVQGKADNIPPNLGGDVMRSILAGTPFPAMWLNAAVQRCRAEQRVTYLRAAAIKACLNRSIRRNDNEKEFAPMLDPSNTNTAYRLGRLFAALEKIQEEASPGLNATIRDRYYGAASTTPVTVFTSLLRLKNAHLKKLNPGRTVWFEKLLAEVLGEVADFPAHLMLPDQGRFALGYYHQRQSFFTKHTDEHPNTSEGK
ncbi:MAG: type I-C CRISPR-associated protein Cas8c/Csd1 [Sterolibacteriaceae bacterium]|uniref:Type I-C CRISPR-associated protein Cas8c/Csd1 n=1 Tax=Candidatus Methylophosphatis roskildensis TaxID=2899263 RepID=A0A9D7HMR5_9PROT|nr:type I-C CRISPR-associated protein Cas8c/Csd1 [Candidatus Methylophosphatis roskildensis]MBK7234632.1 type I-C CRISPR-associated protein Cas8c/Csd1 [Sterolibacteriaceae bacterium]